MAEQNPFAHLKAQPAAEPQRAAPTGPVGVVVPKEPEKPKEPAAGYEPDPNRPGSWRPIPGGPADPQVKGLTESESKAVGFYQRMRSAETQMKRMGMGPQDWSTLIQQRISPTFSRANLSDRQRTQLDLMENWIAASMRLESGATIAPDEFEKQARIFFPQPGAGLEEQSVKDQQRELAILGFRAVAGPGAKEADANLRSLGFIDEAGKPIIPPVARDEQGREIVSPELRVAEGAEYSTDADFQRQRDAAEAWAATQGLPFDQALSQFNAAMQSKGYAAADPQTVNILQWYEQNRPGNRGAVEWALPKSGLRASEAPGRIAALGSGLLTGGTAGLAEEAVGLFDPEAAAKLEAAKRYARENYAGTELLGEVIGGFASPLSRIGRGGTIAGEATRGAVYSGLMGAGEPAAGADLTERLTGGVIGAGLGGAIGGAAQRVLGGRLPRSVRIPPAGGAPEMPIGAVAPEAPPVATIAPEATSMATAAPETRPAGIAAPEAPPVAPVSISEGVAQVSPEMTREELIALAQKAVGKAPGASRARSQLADIARTNPEARAAADRMGLELPVDVLSDNAQLQAVTGLMRSQIGSPSQIAWKQTIDDSVARAHTAMDELEATTDLSQVSADVYKRIDDANEVLKRNASDLRDEVDAAINKRDIVDATNIRTWLKNRIDDYGGGATGLAGLTKQERSLWNLVSKKNPTYALLNKERNAVGQAMSERSGPWIDAAKADLEAIYKQLSDDQMAFVEAKGGQEIADKQRAANTLFKEMYRGRERMQKLFGKDLTGNFPQLLQRAINEGRGGNTKTFDVLMKIVPEDMRGTVITSGLFKAAKTTDETFSFTRFADLYRDLRANSQIYKNVAKSVGPEGEKLLTDLYAISRRISDADKAITRTGASTQLNALNSEKLLTKILKGVGGATAATAAGTMLGGEALTIAGAGLAAVAPEIAQRFGKSNVEKLHNLMASNEFRDLAVSAATNENLNRNINRVASSRPFIDYLKSIGVEAKQGKNWLRSAFTVAPVSGITRQAESQQPIAAPPMAAQQ